MKGQREPSSVSLPRSRLGKVQSGAIGQGLKDKVLVPRNLAPPPPKETGVISPKATMYSVSDVPKITCVPLYNIA